ncbi:DUF6287 domain-containing protein [Streptococcus danieliae]|uniref:DUF6287 domain-containing protein n=1 Tax=Streptococcus danieliae TaxID=747656 RepID=UPI0026EAA4AB|nr:DUF6287 domain-containing protein [Streptococcus danieliae]
MKKYVQKLAVGAGLTLALLAVPQSLLDQPLGRTSSIVLAAEDQDELESDLNAFVQSYLVTVDESTLQKSDKIQRFFDSSSNDNYQKALQEVMDPAYRGFFTTGTPVQELQVKGDTIQFNTYFSREVTTASTADKHYVYGKRSWKLAETDDSFEILSYSTELLDAPTAEPQAKAINLDEILKGDYSSVAGEWTNESNSHLVISPDGMVDRTGHLVNQEEFDGTKFVKVGEVVLAKLANRSHVGKSMNIIFVPKGEEFLPHIAGLDPVDDRDRIVMIENLDDYNPGVLMMFYRG